MKSKKSSSVPVNHFGFRFGLWHLLYAAALIASGLVVIPATFLPSIFILICWAIVYSHKDQVGAIKLVILLFLLSIFLVGLFMPTVQQVREAARRTICRNNMKQIVLVILNYESGFGYLPTDTIVETADGKRLRHSWRIELLPFLEEQALYEQYDYREAWDGPNNSKLADQVGSIWNCPSRDEKPASPYRLVNGPGTAFEIGKKLTFKDIPDGASNCIALVEDHSNPKNWMEPDDFSAEEAAQKMHISDIRNCAHIHHGVFTTTYIGLNIALLDGATYRVGMNAAASPGMFLVDDGVLFDPDLDSGQITVVHYGICVAAGIYIVLIIFPVFFLRQNQANDK